MQGVTTQVSAPKSITYWTKDLKKNSDTCGATPSLLRIRIILCHTTRAIARFLTTTVQSSSATEITRPKYLKEVTISRGRPYALKVLDVTALSFSATRRHLFCCATFFHCARRRCILFRARHGTSMSHRGHHGWGRFHFSKITTVSQTCRYQICNPMAVHIAALPLNTSTGQVLGPVFASNIILNVLVLSPQSPSPYLSFCPAPPLATPCWVWWCAASDPIAKSFPHSIHCTRSRCLSW